MLVGVVLVAAACNVVSTPLAPSTFFFTNDALPNGSGLYVNGPGIPPVGRGSALLTIEGNGREAIASAGYNGIDLAAVSALSYSTYQVSAGATGGAPNLAFDVDYDNTDASTGYQGRLVYVPEQSGTAVTPATWQNWDTMSGSGAWYSSGSGGSAYRPVVGGVAQTDPPCNQASFCTWSAVMAQYPHAQIRGLLLLRVGGNGDPGSAAVDNLHFGVGGQTQFTDFEPGDGHIPVNTTSASGLGFGFAPEPSGSGAFVSGPNGADGSGSAQLTLSTPADGVSIVTNIYAGSVLSNLTFLSYKTYQKTGLNATTLQFDADYDNTDASTAFQGRVVFEPSESAGAPVATETWQTWNPMTASTGWWQTGNPIVGNNPTGTKVCTEGSPCSFQQWLAAYPALAIRGVTGQSSGTPIGGGIWLKAGSNWAPLPFVGNVDSLTIGVKAGLVNGTATYDFEG